MATTLNKRRPIVVESADWLSGFLATVTRLNAASQLLGGRIAMQTWKILDQARDADLTQPVDDQLDLARIVAAHRQVGIAYLCRFPQARGRRRMALTQKGADALTLLEGYDPLLHGAATFDTEVALRRVYTETRYR